MRLLAALLLVITVAFASNASADYALPSPKAVYILLLNRDNVRSIDDNEVTIWISRKTYRIPIDHLLMTDRIYSDAICTGSDDGKTGPAGKRIEEIKTILSKRTSEDSFLLEVTVAQNGMQQLSYINLFDLEKEYQRYCVKKEYYDSLSSLKNNECKNSKEFEELVSSISASGVEAFKQDSMIHNKLQFNADINTHLKDQVNKTKRELVWYKTLFYAMVSGVMLFGLGKAFLNYKSKS